MKSFLLHLVEHHSAKQAEEQLLIFPTKRAIAVFKSIYIQQRTGAVELPATITWSDFIEECSLQRTLTSTEMLLHLHQCFEILYPEEPQQSLQNFSHWGQEILGDFETAKLYEWNGEEVFAQINLLKAMEQWNLDLNSSPVYAQRWSKLSKLFSAFYARLEEMNVQSNASRFENAKINLDDYLPPALKQKKFISFCGFTAFSPVEKSLIAKLQTTYELELFYDLPAWNDELENHEANLFKEENQELFPQFNEVRFESEKKEIHLQECGSAFEASKLVSHLLKDITPEEEQKTAVVLLSDDDLPLLLNALPPHLKDVNIGKGKSYSSTVEGASLQSLLRLYLNLKSTRIWKRDDLLELIRLPVLAKSIPAADISSIEKRLGSAFGEQIITELKELSVELKSILELLEVASDPMSFLERLAALDFWRWLVLPQVIELTKSQLNQMEGNDSNAFLYTFQQNFLKTQIPIEGKKTSGLQILSLLETRCLDFERVIFLSFQDENLPQSPLKTNIPLEIRAQYQLPDQAHRESILSYHFMRLMKRCSESHLIFVNENSGFGKLTPSRFLWQAALEWVKDEQVELHVNKIRMGQSSLVHRELQIEKSDAVYTAIQNYLTQRGLSPSALNVYLNNPMDFFLFHVVGLREKEEVSEQIESSAIGTVVHDALEQLYTPYLGSPSNKMDKTAMLKSIPNAVQLELLKQYPKQALASGRVSILMPVLIQWIKNFIHFDLSDARQEFVLEQLEQSYRSEVKTQERSYFLKGIVDRIDRVNGIPLLIDYKTGKVIQSDLNLSTEEMLQFNPEKTKAYQLLLYTYIYSRNNSANFNTSACSIYSFRNQQAGLLNLKIDRSPEIGPDQFKLFEQGLNNMTEHMLDRSIPIRIQKFRYQKFEV